MKKKILLSAITLTLVLGVALLRLTAQDGATLYTNNCARCHGDGSTNPLTGGNAPFAIAQGMHVIDATGDKRDEVPDIVQSCLVAPLGHRHPISVLCCDSTRIAERLHAAPFTQASFMTAVRSGTDPNGNMLNSAMPMFSPAQIDDASLQSIWTYLGTLSDPANPTSDIRLGPCFALNFSGSATVEFFGPIDSGCVGQAMGTGCSNLSCTDAVNIAKQNAAAQLPGCRFNVISQNCNTGSACTP